MSQIGDMGTRNDREEQTRQAGIMLKKRNQTGNDNSAANKTRSAKTPQPDGHRQNPAEARTLCRPSPEVKKNSWCFRFFHGRLEHFDHIFSQITQDLEDAGVKLQEEKREHHKSLQLNAVKSEEIAKLRQENAKFRQIVDSMDIEPDSALIEQTQQENRRLKSEKQQMAKSVQATNVQIAEAKACIQQLEADKRELQDMANEAHRKSEVLKQSPDRMQIDPPNGTDAARIEQVEQRNREVEAERKVQDTRLQEALDESETLQAKLNQSEADLEQSQMDQGRMTDAKRDADKRAEGADKRAADAESKTADAESKAADAESKAAAAEAKLQEVLAAVKANHVVQETQKVAHSSDTAVHVAFNSESAQRQFSSWADQIVKRTGLGVHAESAPPQGRVKLLLYVIFLAAPRLEQQIELARLAQWRDRAEKVVVVTLRYGRAAQPLQADSASLRKFAPGADALVEYLFMDAKLFDDDVAHMNQGSNQQMCDIARQVYQLQSRAVAPSFGSWPSWMRMSS
jgi:hypothetical protein